MLSPFNVDLTGKVAVVTGGAGIICFPMAKVLHENGAKVVILSLNEDEVKARVDEVDSENFIGFACNVLKKENLEACKKEINEKFGKVDILINGAGGNNPKGTTDNEIMEMEDLNKDIKTFFDLDQEGIEFVLNLNYMGTLLPTQIFATDMIGREGSTILNISSMNAFTPLTKIPAYSGAKAAVSNLTQWLSVHFSHVNIRVNAIAPGFFVTAQNEKLLFNDDKTPTARTGKILRNTPMDRFGKVEELLGATLFLVDEKSSGFITGIVLPIDGGFSAYSGV